MKEPTITNYNDQYYHIITFGKIIDELLSNNKFLPINMTYHQGVLSNTNIGFNSLNFRLSFILIGHYRGGKNVISDLKGNLNMQ